MVITSSVETVTPERAALWLANNYASNRKISPLRVKTLVEIIKTGHWVLTHQGIAFGAEGELLDGQHRLTAIVKAGIPVPLVVSRNVSREAFSAMDRGWNRTMREVCSGVPEPIVHASSWVARLHYVKVAQPYHVHAVVDSELGRAMAEILRACHTKVPRRFSAPTLAVVAHRWMQDHDYVEQQWRAFLLLQRETISPAVWSLVQQIDRADRLDPILKAARTWIGFDPARRYESRIIIRDAGSVMDEIRDAWRPTWPAGEGVAE